MDTLSWLIKHRLESITHREHDWLFSFDGGIHLSVEQLWRLLEFGRIQVTSADQGHQFGLAAPVDGVAILNKAILGRSIEKVQLVDGTLDLELGFNSGYVLQVIPTSAGFEAWQIAAQGKLIIATGGGELAIFESQQTGG